MNFVLPALLMLLALAAAPAQGAPLKIQLFDKASGKPLSDGTIFYSQGPGGKQLAMVADFLKWGRRATTDAQGRATLEDTPPESLEFVVGAPGHAAIRIAPHQRERFQAGDTLKVPLDAAGSISGVVYKKGKPAERVLVILGEGSPGVDWPGCMRDMVKTDALGRYRFPALERGAYHVAADDSNERNDPSRAFRRWVELEPGEQRTVDIGEEPPSAKPAATPSPTPTPEPISGMVQALSLMLRSPMPAKAASVAPPPPPAEGPVTLKLVIDPPAGGKPTLPLGQVYLRLYENGSSVMGAVSLGRPQGDRLVFGGDLMGDYRLERRLNMGGYCDIWITHPAELKIDNSQGPQDLGEIHWALEPCVEITGTALDAEGKPITRAVVRAYPAERWTTSYASAETDSAGKFTMTPMLPMEYEMQVERKAGGVNYWTWIKAEEGKPVELRPGKQPKVIIPLTFGATFDAARRARFTRTMLAKAAKDARMSPWTNNAGDGATPLKGDALTFTGRLRGNFKVQFEYQPTPENAYTAEMTLSERIDTLKGDQTLSAIAPPEPGRLRWEGRAMDGKGEPQRFAKVELKPGFATPWVKLRATCDEAGRFAFADLQPGTYAVTVKGQGSTGYFYEQPTLGMNTVTITGDLKRDLEPGRAGRF